MIKEFLSNTKTRLALGLIVLLVIINVVLSIYRSVAPPQPSLSSINPPSTTTNIDLNQNMTFAFKVPVEAADLTISSTPNLSWKLSQINANTISATHSPDFQPSTTYTINLVWKSLPYPPISLTTVKSQTDPQLIQNMKDELARDYPLAQKLPYNTDAYRVVYSSPLTLEIALKDKSYSKADAISEMKLWVTKSGGDSLAHKYIIAP
jgi:hypothetical protein